MRCNIISSVLLIVEAACVHFVNVYNASNLTTTAFFEDCSWWLLDKAYDLMKTAYKQWKEKKSPPAATIFVTHGCNGFLSTRYFSVILLSAAKLLRAFEVVLALDCVLAAAFWIPKTYYATFISFLASFIISRTHQRLRKCGEYLE